MKSEVILQQKSSTGENIDKLLSEKLTQGWSLIQRCCPVCSISLVKANISQYDNTPLSNMPYCVACDAHIIIDRKMIDCVPSFIDEDVTASNGKFFLTGSMLDDTEVMLQRTRTDFSLSGTSKLHHIDEQTCEARMPPNETQNNVDERDADSEFGNHKTHQPGTTITNEESKNVVFPASLSALLVKENKKSTLSMEVSERRLEGNKSKDVQSETSSRPLVERNEYVECEVSPDIPTQRLEKSNEEGPNVESKVDEPSSILDSEHQEKFFISGNFNDMLKRAEEARLEAEIRKNDLEKRVNQMKLLESFLDSTDKKAGRKADEETKKATDARYEEEKRKRENKIKLARTKQNADFKSENISEKGKKIDSETKPPGNEDAPVLCDLNEETTGCVNISPRSPPSKKLNIIGEASFKSFNSLVKNDLTQSFPERINTDENKLENDFKFLENLEEVALNKVKAADEAINKARAAMTQISGSKSKTIVSTLDKAEAVIAEKAECFTNFKEYEGKSLKERSSKIRDLLAKRVLRGWVIVSSTYCRGDLCGYSPLVRLYGQDPECVVCRGSGTGKDGLYACTTPTEIMRIKDELDNNHTADIGKKTEEKIKNDIVEDRSFENYQGLSSHNLPKLFHPSSNGGSKSEREGEIGNKIMTENHGSLEKEVELVSKLSDSQKSGINLKSTKFYSVTEEHQNVSIIQYMGGVEERIRTDVEKVFLKQEIDRKGKNEINLSEIEDNALNVEEKNCYLFTDQENKKVMAKRVLTETDVRIEYNTLVSTKENLQCEKNGEKNAFNILMSKNNHNLCGDKNTDDEKYSLENIPLPIASKDESLTMFSKDESLLTMSPEDAMVINVKSGYQRLGNEYPVESCEKDDEICLESVKKEQLINNENEKNCEELGLETLPANTGVCIMDEQSSNLQNNHSSEVTKDSVMNNNQYIPSEVSGEHEYCQDISSKSNKNAVLMDEHLETKVVTDEKINTPKSKTCKVTPKCDNSFDSYNVEQELERIKALAHERAKEQMLHEQVDNVVITTNVNLDIDELVEKKDTGFGEMAVIESNVVTINNITETGDNKNESTYTSEFVRMREMIVEEDLDEVDKQRVFDYTSNTDYSALESEINLEQNIVDSTHDKEILTNTIETPNVPVELGNKEGEKKEFYSKSLCEVVSDAMPSSQAEVCSKNEIDAFGLDAGRRIDPICLDNEVDSYYARIYGENIDAKIELEYSESTVQLSTSLITTELTIKTDDECNLSSSQRQCAWNSLIRNELTNSSSSPRLGFTEDSNIVQLSPYPNYPGMGREAEIGSYSELVDVKMLLNEPGNKTARNIKDLHSESASVKSGLEFEQEASGKESNCDTSEILFGKNEVEIQNKVVSSIDEGKVYDNEDGEEEVVVCVTETRIKDTSTIYVNEQLKIKLEYPELTAEMSKEEPAAPEIIVGKDKVENEFEIQSEHLSNIDRYINLEKEDHVNEGKAVVDFSETITYDSPTGFVNELGEVKLEHPESAVVKRNTKANPRFDNSNANEEDVYYEKDELNTNDLVFNHNDPEIVRESKIDCFSKLGNVNLKLNKPKNEISTNTEELEMKSSLEQRDKNFGSEVLFCGKLKYDIPEINHHGNDKRDIPKKIMSIGDKFSKYDESRTEMQGESKNEKKSEPEAKSVTLQLPSSFDYNDKDAVKFVLQQLKMIQTNSKPVSKEEITEFSSEVTSHNRTVCADDLISDSKQLGLSSFGSKSKLNCIIYEPVVPFLADTLSCTIGEMLKEGWILVDELPCKNCNAPLMSCKNSLDVKPQCVNVECTSNNIEGVCFKSWSGDGEISHDDRSEDSFSVEDDPIAIELQMKEMERRGFLKGQTDGGSNTETVEGKCRSEQINLVADQGCSEIKNVEDQAQGNVADTTVSIENEVTFLEISEEQSFSIENNLSKETHESFVLEDDNNTEINNVSFGEKVVTEQISYFADQEIYSELMHIEDLVKESLVDTVSIENEDGALPKVTAEQLHSIENDSLKEAYESLPMDVENNTEMNNIGFGERFTSEENNANAVQESCPDSNINDLAQDNNNGNTKSIGNEFRKNIEEQLFSTESDLIKEAHESLPATKNIISDLHINYVALRKEECIEQYYHRFSNNETNQHCFEDMESKQLNDLETPPEASTTNIIMTSIDECQIGYDDHEIQEEQVHPPENESANDHEIGYNATYSENLSNRIAEVSPSVSESRKDSPKKKYGPPMPEDDFSCDTYRQTEMKQYRPCRADVTRFTSSSYNEIFETRKIQQYPEKAAEETKNNMSNFDGPPQPDMMVDECKDEQQCTSGDIRLSEECDGLPLIIEGVHHQNDYDSVLSFDSYGPGSTLGSDALAQILSKIEHAKEELKRPISGDFSMLKNEVSNHIEMAELIERLASATISAKTQK